MKALDHLTRKNTDGNAKPPAIIQLHGIGSDMRDLFSFSGALPEKYFVISAQAPRSFMHGGYAWYDIHWSGSGGIHFSEADVEVAAAVIADFIEWAVSEYNLDPEHILLMGFSQGAILSLGTALQNPGLVAGVIALSGYLLPQFNNIEIHHSEEDDDDSTKQDEKPEDKRIFRHKYKASDQDLPLKIFMSHGTHDDVIPVYKARETADIMRALPLDFSYKEYPMPHSISPECFTDMMQWLEKNF